MDPETYATKLREKSVKNQTSASKAFVQKRAAMRQAVEAQAVRTWPEMKENPELMGFLGLYWGEGDKRSQALSIVNNDPGVIKAALTIFSRLSPDARFDLNVRCYPDQDKIECKAYWEAALGKPVRVLDKKWVGNKKKALSQHGLCTLRYSDWEVKTRIMRWIRCWREDLVGVVGYDPTTSRPQIEPSAN